MTIFKIKSDGAVINLRQEEVEEVWSCLSCCSDNEELIEFFTYIKDTIIQRKPLIVRE